MVDALVSNTSDASRAGSSPALGTILNGCRAGLPTEGWFEFCLVYNFLDVLLGICDHKSVKAIHLCGLDL